MMRAKEYLLQIQKIDAYLITRQEDIARWKDIAENTTVQPKTIIKQTSAGFEKLIIPPSSGKGTTGDKVGNSVAIYVDMEDQYREEVKELLALRSEIIKTIRDMKRRDYMEILLKKYVLGKSFQEIANEMDRTYTQITTTHGRALKEYEDENHDKLL